MTIFLTTQYLEEADELGRPGRHHRRRPHRRRGHARPSSSAPSAHDVIVARVDGDADPARRGRSTACPSVDAVEAHGTTSSSSASTNGSADDQPGRGRAGTTPTSRSATSRCARRRSTTCSSSSPATASSTDDDHADAPTTPTTGRPTDRRRRTGGRPMTTIDVATPVDLTVRPPGPTGFVHDTVTIAGRALRAVPRDLEAVIPPVFIALFFFVVNIATLQSLTEGIDRRLRLHGVPDADRDPARRHRRLAGAGARARRAGRLLRPAAAHPGPAHCRSCSGHMVADVAVAAGAHRADPRRSASSSACASRPAPLGVLVFIAHRRAVEPGLRRLRLRDRAEDRQPGRGATRASCCSSRSCSSRRRTCPAIAAHGWLDTVAAWQPGHLPARGAALAGPRSAGTWSDLGAGAARHRDRRRREHVAVLRRPPRPGPPVLIRPTSGGLRNPAPRPHNRARWGA